MSSASPWLAPVHIPAAPRVRLYCLPYTGGGAAVYRSWRTHLPPGVELWVLRPPGADGRRHERPFHRLMPLVDALEDALGPHLDLPYGIFGHSVGAITGYEVARRLEQSGSGPRHLWVSAHRAPHLRQSAPLVHLAPDDVILSRLRRLGGGLETSAESGESVSELLANIRAELAASETYRHVDPTPLRCALSAFGGLDDQIVPAATIDEWKLASAGPFRAQLFDGSHYYWVADPAPLLREIGADLRDSFAELSSV